MGAATQYTNPSTSKPRHRNRATLNSYEITNAVLRATASAIGIMAYGKQITAILKDKRLKTGHITLLATGGLLATPQRPYFCIADLKELSPYSIDTNYMFIRNLVKCGYLEKAVTPATHNGNTKFYSLSHKGFSLLHTFKRNMEAEILRLDSWVQNR